MRHMPARLLAVLFVIAAVAAGCGASDESADGSADNSSTTAPVSDEDTEDAAPTTDSEPEATTTTAAVEADPPAADTEPQEVGGAVDEGDDALTLSDTAVDNSALNFVTPPAPACSAPPAVSVGLTTGTLESGGIEYDYQWTVPSTYDGSAIPVVLDFHGLGSNGAQQALFAGWSAKAESDGFLAVQPTGSTVDSDGRNAWELPQLDSPLRNDIAMVVDLLDLVSANICIDSARVYATGMSNGSFFTSTLVCDLSERIAAAASVAGVTHHESCDPTRAVPYLAFHGTADTRVPFNGGGESTLDGASQAGDFFEQVIPDEFAEFAGDFGCTEATDSQVTPEVTLTSYAGCDDDVPLGFYTIEGGGHTWPGSAISAAISSLGETNLDISATDLAWDFFTQQSLEP